MFTLRINNEPHEFDEPLSVADLVASFTGSAGSAGIAVAVDAMVVPAAQWAETTLDSDHTVDILTAAQGG